MRRLIALVPFLWLALGGCRRARPGADPGRDALLRRCGLANGNLPPVERAPAGGRRWSSRLAEPGPGKYGGDLHMLMAAAKDTRMMVVYGYARLVRYDAGLQARARHRSRVLRRQGRPHLHLPSAQGHKWSDGQPFTTEDFRYSGRTSPTTSDLSRPARRSELLVDGEAPKFEVLDQTTVRYSWSKPNALFLPALAGARRSSSTGRRHYLKQFHAKYADPERAGGAGQGMPACATGRRSTTKRDNLYQNDNPDLPTLDPWVLQTKPPADRFVFERNPYFHRVDAAGRQLPYIDQVVLDDRRRQADPGQDRRRRERSAGALPPLQQLHLPQGGREAQRLHGAALAHGARLAGRALSQPERRTIRSGARCCATCASAARCRWRSTATRSTR